ncbi:MAG: hypothetical protein COW03_07930 [Cytophagales bacterium CG12_big_fil_rev_8_21_14_0_65_40_12]|nr:MAG: hypothetical protein COW03_07930 [Cytophagales bacterium CG12_big_fil_rev_8_21_14_0_65_40_12]PIW06260.1 MAG: hypothetical protein COW40_00215 [Cytophagales bacterium CG17_big_fil_post_rev_8_21_14_2_50_40_13]
MLFGQAAAFGQRKNATDQKIYEYLDKYSPESSEMLRLLYSLPSSYELNGVTLQLSGEQAPSSWVSDHSEKGIMEALNTVVHESMHGLTSRLPYALLKAEGEIGYNFDDSYSAFYVNKDSSYLVKHSPVFNSNKITNEIPKTLRTFRFKPYIAPRSNTLGSQANGIYGLMDEWNAYYFGTKAAFDLFEYYKSKSGENYEVYLNHVSNLAGTYYAYYEFKYFILKYLEFAQLNEKAVYEGILSNIEFRKAFTSIDQRFAALLDQFEERLEEIAKLPASNERDSVYQENGYYFINETGVGLFTNEVEMLKAELDKPNLKELAIALRLE